MRHQVEGVEVTQSKIKHMPSDLYAVSSDIISICRA